jgi:hypothetical protein
MNPITRHCCTLCGWYTDNPAEPAAEARAVWHTFRDHPQAWLELAGFRPPAAPDPATPLGYAYLATLTEVN